MPTLEVKPGTSLFYLDSGAPDPPNDIPYMTLFMLHGHTFHSPAFNRAINASRKFNIRFVAITRRDYPGSSSLTPEDVKANVEGSTSQRIQVTIERAGEIMEFIKEFIAKNDIPPISPNREGGGFSLSGWSLGNVQGFSVLASGDRFPDLAQKLKPYFRSYISYEAVLFAPPPNIKGYSPMLDESIPREHRQSRFVEWISSYFDHPPEAIASGDPSLLNQTTPSATKPFSASDFTPEEHAAIIGDATSIRADLFYHRMDPQVIERILRDAFIQTNTPWPDVPVRLIWSDKTSWSVVFSQHGAVRWIAGIKEENKDGWVRSNESVCVSGGNHFLHWDEPDRFMETIKRLML